VEYAEQIALYKGEGRERGFVDGLLDKLLMRQKTVVYTQFPLNGTLIVLVDNDVAITQTISYFGSILSYLIIAIPIFSGEFDGSSPSDIASYISLVPK
jgi:ATP-binding cassette subfamily D (ALD) protein 4